MKVYLLENDNTKHVTFAANFVNVKKELGEFLRMWDEAQIDTSLIYCKNTGFILNVTVRLVDDFLSRSKFAIRSVLRTFYCKSVSVYTVLL